MAEISGEKPSFTEKDAVHQQAVRTQPFTVVDDRLFNDF